MSIESGYYSFKVFLDFKIQAKQLMKLVSAE
jgi:hypothetical protein